MINQLLPDYFDDNYRPELVADATHRVIGNEAIIWSPNWPTPHILDGVAQLLVSVFDGVATRSELIAELHDELGVEPDVAGEQITRVLEGLAKNGLLPFSEDFPAWNPPRSLLPPPNF